MPLAQLKQLMKNTSKQRNVLPAMGYSDTQIKELEETINAIPADVVVIGTPIDLRRVIKINKPAVRVRYELQEIGKPDLNDVITKKFGG